MGIVLAGQVWLRGMPVPGPALSEANTSLFRSITVQVGKTLGDFSIKGRRSSKWIAAEERLF